MQIRATPTAFAPPARTAPDTAAPARDGAGARLRLDRAQLAQVERLRQRDREVRAHEMAHLLAAGAYALGGPAFEYQVGPDGRRYAIGGHVNIDTSPVAGNPEATLRKAETIQRAALAPGDPSPQDRSVAAAAAAMALKARIEIQQRRQHGDAPPGAREAGAKAYGDVRVAGVEDAPEVDLYG